MGTLLQDDSRDLEPIGRPRRLSTPKLPESLRDKSRLLVGCPPSQWRMPTNSRHYYIAGGGALAPLALHGGWRGPSRARNTAVAAATTRAFHRAAAGDRQAPVAGRGQRRVHALALGTHDVDQSWRRIEREQVLAAAHRMAARPASAGAAAEHRLPAGAPAAPLRHRPRPPVRRHRTRPVPIRPATAPPHRNARPSAGSRRSCADCRPRPARSPALAQRRPASPATRPAPAARP